MASFNFYISTVHPQLWALERHCGAKMLPMLSASSCSALCRRPQTGMHRDAQACTCAAVIHIQFIHVLLFEPPFSAWCIYCTRPRHHMAPGG
mmetsp:Transcript_166383/g.534456  ORF Transcript_166383/g.534456 Transcript_166383/m.534456 type:complete len:92 (-) Transcript_166383:37-312(-)